MASPTSSRVALIFGAGSNIGAGLVKGFLGAGYRVATVSRSNIPTTTTTTTSTLRVQADLSDPATVPGVFAQLSAAGWPAPSVVVWNAANWTRPAAADPENPLEVPLEAFGRDLGVMVTSPYVAAREAVRVWKKKEEEQQQQTTTTPTTNKGGSVGRKGTFIMTGNLTPKKILPVPALVDLGVGKSAANYWVGLSDAVLRKEGIRFFFADERKADGGPVGAKPDGDGHSEMFLRLTEDDELPHYVTFVDGKYKEFP